MINLNGFKFAENEKEIVDSLFQTDGTVSGQIKRNRRSIYFYDLQGDIFAFMNCHGVTGTASKMANGKNWFQYGTPFFTKGLSYREEKELPVQLAVGKDSKGLIFK